MRRCCIRCGRVNMLQTFEVELDGRTGAAIFLCKYCFAAAGEQAKITVQFQPAWFKKPGGTEISLPSKRLKGHDTQD